VSTLKRLTINLTALCALALSALATSVATGRECALIPSGEANIETFEIAEQLSDTKFAEVEAALAKRHRKNLDSDGGDLLSLRDIVAIIQLSGSQQNLVRMWAEQRPQSFFSQYTAGVYFADRAGGILGGKPVSQGTASQLKNLQDLGETAERYLQNAIRLDQKSALPHAAMLGIAQTRAQAGGRTAAQWLQSANKVDPKNLAMRINAVNYLSPRWGGSFELLDQMSQQADKVLSANAAHYLRYNVQLARASHEEVIAKNKPAAHVLYKQAVDMCANSKTARDGSIRTYQ
jgi:hypothetical protein